MLFGTKKMKIDYTEEWPKHYLEIRDPDEREAVLRKMLSEEEEAFNEILSSDRTEAGKTETAEGPAGRSADENMRLKTLKKQVEDDRRRLLVFLKRYPEKTKRGRMRRDGFVAAWMDILITGRQGNGLFSGRRNQTRLRKDLEDLGVLNCEEDAFLHEEWENFAKAWLEMCATDRNYTTAAFGFFHLQDESIAAKIARELDDVTRKIPEQMDVCRSDEERRRLENFRNAVLNVYADNIEDGRNIFNREISS